MFEISGFHKKVTELILDTPAPGKHCARNAIAHIKKAWEIREIDPEMAAFRAITGEEEAATAIMHSLRRRKYKGAEKLNYRDHTYKAAVFPFFQGISGAFARQLEQFKTTLVIDTNDKKPTLKTRINVPGPTGDIMHAYPNPPLHFEIKVNGKIYDFSRELKELATVKNVKKITDYIKRQANTRNVILYASTQGIPKIKLPIEGFLERKRSIVFGHLVIYLLIDQHKEHQLFVQQALTAFLKMLNAVPKDIIFA